jgi:hypothetical protein
VGAADAGSTLTCECRRTVDVPPLHELRHAVGELTLSPELLIQDLIGRGEVPPGPECVWCGAPTTGEVCVHVRCEQAEEHVRSASRALSAASALTLWFGMLVFRREPRDVQIRGRDVAFDLPLRACPACAAGRRAVADLRTALAAVPEYAALLAKYPHARVSRSR